MKKFLIYTATLIVLFSSFLLKSDNTYLDDFLQYWNDVNDNYAYFRKKSTDWNRVKDYYSPLALKAGSRDDLISILEKASEELYDNHFNLNTNLMSSTRMVPSGLDMWAEFVNEEVVVTEVRQGFSAHKAGIRSGMVITKINDIDVAMAVKSRMGNCITSIDKEVRGFFLRQLLAGNYLTERTFTFKENGSEIILKPDKEDGNLTDGFKDDSLMLVKILPGNLGYLRINNSLGDNDLIRAFDSALLNVKNTSALILDLRETPGGGNSTVARAIMSRFIDSEKPYQKHVDPREEIAFGVRRSWLELVTPRGPFIYGGKMVVLSSHWTGSMGEGIVIGFHGMKRATIIGTEMAGLNGSIESFVTKNHDIPYSFPTEQIFHIDGKPREDFVPDILIDLTNDKYRNDPDPVLSEGINILKK